jgi:hypothetical protein
MGGIQERLNKLKPYVKGMRFVNTTAVVDVQLKGNWNILDSDKISVKKGKTEENYFMFFSEDESISFDDILDHVEKVINVNIENEKKLELIKIKIEELKRYFENKSLEVLKTLRFEFDEITPTILEDKTVELEIENNQETH